MPEKLIKSFASHGVEILVCLLRQLLKFRVAKQPKFRSHQFPHPITLTEEQAKDMINFYSQIPDNMLEFIAD